MQNANDLSYRTEKKDYDSSPLPTYRQPLVPLESRPGLATKKSLMREGSRISYLKMHSVLQNSKAHLSLPNLEYDL